MPWAIADVEQHSKGLTDAQKAVWVKVANAALTKCESEGGEACDASAIKQANAVVAKNMSFEAWASVYAQVKTHNISGVEIFSEGKWNGDVYTAADLDALVSAFNQVGFEPPLKLGHNSQQEKDLMLDGQPALGWVARIYREGAKLLADFKDVPSKLYEAIKRGNYKRVSSEIYWNYGANGKQWPRVLKAVALLGADIPAVTNLESIAGLYREGAAEYRVYTTKTEETGMTEQEVKELKAKLDEATGKVVSLEAANKGLTTEKADLEVRFTQSATELSERKAALRKTEVKEFIRARKAEGRLVPAFEAEVEALLMSATDTKVHTFASDVCAKCDGSGKMPDGTKCPDCNGTGKVAAHSVTLSQRETMERFFGRLPKIVDFAELGRGAPDEAGFTGDYEDAGAEVDKRAKYLVGKGTVKTYAEAVAMALDKDEELKKKYAGGK